MSQVNRDRVVSTPVTPVAWTEKIKQTSLWSSAKVNAPRHDEGTPIELGTRFKVGQGGSITGVRFYKSAASSKGQYVGSLWDSKGNRLASVNFQSGTGAGWQAASFAKPVKMQAGKSYTVSYHNPDGSYPGVRGFFADGSLKSGPLSAMNGAYSYGKTGYPKFSHSAHFNYFVDVMFEYRTWIPRRHPTPGPSVSLTPSSDPTSRDDATPSATSTTTVSPTAEPSGTPQPSGTGEPSAIPSTSPKPSSSGSASAIGKPPTTSPSTTLEPTQTGKPSVTPTVIPTAGTSPPSNGSWPDETSTGPSTGALTKNKGGEIRQNGLVLNGVEFTGSVDVYASNVTIRNCRFIGGGHWGIQLRDGYTNLTVENCEIAGDGVNQLSVGVKNIGNGTMTVRGNDIHTVTDGIRTATGLIADNYIHDLKEFPGDHMDGIQSDGGSGGNPLVIRHNSISNEADETSAIILGTPGGPLDGVTIQGNLIGGGGYCVYGGGETARNIVIRDNAFSRQIYPRCGYFGPVAHFESGNPGNMWSGNVWADNGQAIKP